MAKASVLCSAELATLDKLYDNVAGYPYAKDWKAFREQEKQEASVRYMIVDNGKNSYVKADRQVFTSSNIHNRAVALENYLNSKIDHTGHLEIPTADGDAIRITNNEDTIRRNTVGKLTSFDEYIDENGRWDKSSILLKQNIALHIDEVIAVSRPTNERRSDNGYKHDEFAQKGWSYRTAYFQDYDGSYYRVKISIAENDSGKVAYNVNKFRKRNEAFSGKITGSSFSGAQSRESFNDDIVSDSSENGKENFSQNDNTGNRNYQAELYELQRKRTAILEADEAYRKAEEQRKQATTFSERVEASRALKEAKAKIDTIEIDQRISELRELITAARDEKNQRHRREQEQYADSKTENPTAPATSLLAGKGLSFFCLHCIIYIKGCASTWFARKER